MPLFTSHIDRFDEGIQIHAQRINGLAWPPNCPKLTDLQVFFVELFFLKGGREKNVHWPSDFETDGFIRTDRLPQDPTVVFKDEQGDYAYPVANNGVILCVRVAAIQHGLDWLCETIGTGHAGHSFRLTVKVPQSIDVQATYQYRDRVTLNNVSYTFQSILHASAKQTQDTVNTLEGAAAPANPLPANLLPAGPLSAGPHAAEPLPANLPTAEPHLTDPPDAGQPHAGQANPVGNSLITSAQAVARRWQANRRQTADIFGRVIQQRDNEMDRRDDLIDHYISENNRLRKMLHDAGVYP